jgi:hypothetical protein
MALVTKFAAFSRIKLVAYAAFNNMRCRTIVRDWWWRGNISRRSGRF